MADKRKFVDEVLNLALQDIMNKYSLSESELLDIISRVNVAK